MRRRVVPEEPRQEKPKLVVEPVLPLPPQTPEQQFEKRKQYSVWFRPTIYKQIQHEAIDREMSVGEVLEEAMQARIMFIDRSGGSRK